MEKGSWLELATSCFGHCPGPSKTLTSHRHQSTLPNVCGKVEIPGQAAETTAAESWGLQLNKYELVSSCNVSPAQK